MRIAAIVVAAGRGTRVASGGPLPKQYLTLAGRPLIAHTLEALGAAPEIAAFQAVIHADDRALYTSAVRDCTVSICEALTAVWKLLATTLTMSLFKGRLACVQPLTPPLRMDNSFRPSTLSVQ